MHGNSISVVIPTYNREHQLEQVIDCLFNCDTEGIENVEIIVVDDGSLIPSNDVLETLKTKKPFTVRYLRQENSGPAKARNNGLRESSYDVVLFIDDDILTTPNLLKIHARAHRVKTNSVIFGSCPYPETEEKDSAYRFLVGLASIDSAVLDDEEFKRMKTVASGNLSIEKKMFLPDGLYRDDLTIPAAEEFELIYRLTSQNIPIYFAKKAIGWHLQPTAIKDKCAQEYKYGLGISEASIKYPDLSKIEMFKNFLDVNGKSSNEDLLSLKLQKATKRLLVISPVRNLLLATVNFFERITQKDWFLFPLYRILAGLFLFAGIRDGLKKFEFRES